MLGVCKNNNLYKINQQEIFYFSLLNSLTKKYWTNNCVLNYLYSQGKEQAEVVRTITMRQQQVKCCRLQENGVSVLQQGELLVCSCSMGRTSSAPTVYVLHPPLEEQSIKDLTHKSFLCVQLTLFIYDVDRAPNYLSPLGWTSSATAGVSRPTE